ncbi:hypothetical protein DICPUDRAFT_82173 [Dictyostelium purpureum]|uniref:Rab GTPase n=1 Tax=Dictyostelium purpureum TaxID=5786 RepID=F0ZVR1_DICPU|nr:uncharacterized protein DICPUDRAFT_82173 [Dictyostelium purpureum]EGC31965.1 hypothetical protein DICPUDRAFT_82173 [Dictyostelium purpureum]|eukprot:XP_003291501.1 hypothetical protein DICPUDRAFT_82173 [Dictyostelium purpureum]
MYSVSKIENNYDHSLKIILSGDSGSGKTSILSRYFEDIYSDEFPITYTQDQKEKTIILEDKKIKLNVCDTAGQERFRMICHSPYRGVQGIVIVFDLTDFNSFDNVKRWYCEGERYASEGTPVIIVGNKIDLVDLKKNDQVVSNEVIKELADSLGAPYIETSAKYNINVEKLFLNIVQNILYYKGYISTVSPSKPIILKKEPKDKSCIIN